MEPSPRVARALLVVATTCFTGLLVCAAGWWMAFHFPSVDNLSSRERQKLVDSLLAQSPGLYQWAYFEPRIGYTMRPNSALSAWGDRFTTNDLGYRTGPSAKPADTLRVLFVGDSWTFGMGIKRAETFAEVTARLANQHAGEKRRVEAWTLALPGYNLLDETTALWFFYGRLQPDVVVLCPAGNDNHSTLEVLPNGSTTEAGVMPDDFGDPHVIAYHMRRLDSYRYQERWRRGFAAVRDTAARLQHQGVPLLVFFVGRWNDVDAHAMMANNDVPAPYVVVPIELTKGQWSTTQWGHGNAAANQLYGGMVYRGLAALLGWPALPAGDRRADVPVYRQPPPGDWRAREQQLAAEMSQLTIPESLTRAAGGAERQVVGPFERKERAFGRATTVLVRRRPGVDRLSIAVRRLPEAGYLYPLDLTVSIPSPAGGTRRVVTVPAAGPDPMRFTIDIPRDLAPSAVLDVTLVADRATAAPDVLVGRSLLLEEIVPAP
ncbi:MAG TPA: SGNH/GDSL hydrolase family protein [Thermoanaerobaculia bacterium]|jgi:hypothetical protein|nr:SGNH/GDSL hydrolase family protein [Thermoanaerobaculia bacterium]